MVLLIAETGYTAYYVYYYRDAVDDPSGVALKL
jgi:hypothetical protein